MIEKYDCIMSMKNEPKTKNYSNFAKKELLESWSNNILAYLNMRSKNNIFSIQILGIACFFNEYITIERFYGMYVCAGKKSTGVGIFSFNVCIELKT